jgi:hypothetical protein
MTTLYKLNLCKISTTLFSTVQPNSRLQPIREINDISTVINNHQADTITTLTVHDLTFYTTSRFLRPPRFNQLHLR